MGAVTIIDLRTPIVCDDNVIDHCFLQDKNGNVFTGKVWPGITAFLDFFNPVTPQYWSDQVNTMSECYSI